MSTKNFVKEYITKLNESSKKFAEKFSKDSENYYITKGNHVKFLDEILPHSHHQYNTESCVKVMYKFSGTYLVIPISCITVINKELFEEKCKENQERLYNIIHEELAWPTLSCSHYFDYRGPETLPEDYLD